MAEIVFALHGHEGRRQSRRRDMQDLGETPRRQSRHADVSHLSGTDHVRECVDQFVQIRLRVPDVGLVEIDIVRFQALQRGIDPIEDVLAGKPASVRVVRHGVANLGGHDDFVPGGVFEKRAPQDGFALADGIEIAGVEKIDAAVQRLFDNGPAIGVVEHPFAPVARPKPHGPQGKARDFQIGFSESNILHLGQSAPWSVTSCDGFVFVFA